MDWNKKDSIKKGIKGFVRIEEKRTERIMIPFTTGQVKLINDYCNSQDIQRTEFIREAIYQYLKSKGVNPDVKPKEDKRQMKIFEG